MSKSTEKLSSDAFLHPLFEQSEAMHGTARPASQTTCREAESLLLSTINLFS
jgi:hypothetical protein